SIVQYDETDLDFVLRLSEHLGITMFVEQGEEADRVVFCDHNDAFVDQGPVAFQGRGERTDVYALRSTARRTLQNYGVKDYNYRTPALALKTTESVVGGHDGYRYEYGAHLKVPSEAEYIARMRAEEEACRGVLHYGSSTLPVLYPGAKVTLEGHPLGETPLVIREVVHDFTNPTFLHGGTGDEGGYDNQFVALSAEVPFRPARVTPKPRIYGCITAMVEAAGDGPYADIDDQGRYRVRFAFDVGDKDRAKASRLVRMAQPHAGPGYGFHFPLRHGVEVLITFIDGDPDRPIISAAVPNPQTPSVVTASNGARNIIRTGSGNEINIDDTEGSERIKLSVPFSETSFQLGSPNNPGAGIAMSTLASHNAVAKSSVTTGSSLVSVFSDIASCFASADIIDFAGVNNITSALLEKAPGMVKKVADAADGWMDFKAADEAQGITNVEQRLKALEAEESQLQEEVAQDRVAWEAHDPDNASPPPHSNEPRLKQIAKQKQQYNKSLEVLRKRKEENDQERKETKEYTEAVKHGADFVQTAKDGKKMLSGIGEAWEDRGKGHSAAGKRDAWTKASDVASKTAQSAAGTAAKAAAAAGSAFASSPRISGSVPSPGSPMNLQAAANGAVLFGGSSALVAAPQASMAAASSAIVAAGGKALVKSFGSAEMSGLARVNLTSGAAVDSLSGGTFQSVSASSSKIIAGSSLLLKGGGPTTVLGATITARGTGKVSIKSGAAMSLTSGAAMNLQASGVMHLKAGGAFVAQGSKVNLKSKGKLNAQASGAWTGKGATVSLKSDGKAELTGTDVTVSGKGGVTIKGASPKIKGDGGVTIKAATIKASGRVLLG
ncbi:MAG: type VI secretion system tip protein TssI/VgrG, partial [Myxococcota bacterium]